MAPTLMTLPPEIREVIYEFYFVSYGACTHPGGLNKFKHNDPGAQPWCSEVEEWQALNKKPAEPATHDPHYVCEAEYDWAYHPPSYPAGRPVNLLVVNRLVYQEAREVFVRQIPFRFVFPRSHVDLFLWRYRHAAPGRNVRSLVVEWTEEEWDDAIYGGGGQYRTLPDHWLPLLAKTFPAVERLEICLTKCNPLAYYFAIRDHLPCFQSL
ncbi:hypothetical protein LTR56_023086 [Elasticomyces elasticus]|nr:hypothetical protein LTR56_023086 [Elasticomyces elasticus]KAK3639655.1 hypothetical protein LTR22_017328 [Elasticomyces elasticus]KAK4913433.1 hypothetical protein LTR49_018229 [Elasticomyces elasticus]KAK5760997.1 hypothetical protein LTS12_008845 [Elasticomyces elasticus]